MIRYRFKYILIINSIIDFIFFVFAISKNIKVFLKVNFEKFLEKFILEK